MWHSWTAAAGKLLANNGGSSVRWNLLDAVAVDGNNVMPVADSNIHLQMTANKNTHVATLTGSCEAGKLESEGRQNTLQQALDNCANDCGRFFWPTGGCCLEQWGLPVICITVARVFPRYETCSLYLMHFSG